MLYTSAFGDAWCIYIVAKSINIVKELKDRKAIPSIKCADFWDRVIKELEIKLKTK